MTGPRPEPRTSGAGVGFPALAWGMGCAYQANVAAEVVALVQVERAHAARRAHRAHRAARARCAHVEESDHLATRRRPR